MLGGTESDVVSLGIRQQIAGFSSERQRSRKTMGGAI
jgi:hypothetical protein